MKDFSFFFLKNFMGAKLRRSFRNSCNGDNSTSTLNQHEQQSASSQVPSSSSYNIESHDYIAPPDIITPRKSVTLEEMILQLELEEDMARKEKAAKYKCKGGEIDEIRANFPRRMSCVNNSDILRSARNALNQYPRFSLDGRDAMFRSSFHNNNNHLSTAIDGLKLGRILHLPQSVGGESVIWCTPGVVPKLMGLEAMPIPISRLHSSNNQKNKKNKHSKENLCNSIRNQNLRRKAERYELERSHRRHNVSTSHSCLDPNYGLGGPILCPTPYNYT